MPADHDLPRRSPHRHAHEEGVNCSDLVLRGPAPSFYEAFLLGNGSLGAALHGHTGRERIDLNLDTLWSGGPEQPDRDRASMPAQWLPGLRQAVRDRDWNRADQAALRLQSGRWSQSYQPVGAVWWAYGAPDAAAVPERRLRMAEGTACTQYDTADGAVRLDAWVVSAPDVVILEASGAIGDGLVEFESPHPGVDLALDDTAAIPVHTWAGRVPADVIPDYLGDVPEAVQYDDGSPDAEGLVDRGMGFAVAGLVDRSSPDRLRLILAVVDGFRGPAMRPSADLDALRAAAVDRVRAAAPRAGELIELAAAARRALFERVTLDLPTDPADEADGHAGPAEVERFFHLGRHLLLSSSRQGSRPANLQGIWNQDVRPGWSCNWTVNINLPMNYWPAMPLDLPETVEPFFDLLDVVQETGAVTARTFYDAPGWTVHHNTDLWGFSVPVHGSAPADDAYANWPVGGLWLTAQAASMAAYLPEGPERLAMQRRLAPAVAGAASFAFSLLEPFTDGRLVTNPSTSPEHLFLTSDGSAHAISAGSTMDQELVRATLRNALHWHEHVLPQHEETADVLRRALADLRHPVIGSDGTLLEWPDERPPAEPGHRHVSHLFGLFPGDSIDEVTTPELFEAARRSLRSRIDNGGGHTGWSQAWILCLAARLRDAPLVQESLDILIHRLTSAALLDLHPVPNHPSGYRFQIDGNFGAAAGIVEALVSGRPGRIVLLPALPERWRRGALRGVVVPGGHRVDTRWEAGVLRSARIRAEGTEELQISLPDGPALQLRESTDAGLVPVTLAHATAPHGRRALRWQASPGAELLIEVDRDI